MNKMENWTENIFDELYDLRPKSNSDFVVTNFYGFKNHKIALDKNENCCVLIYSKVSKKITYPDLDSFQNIEVLLNRECDYKHKSGKTKSSFFTIIKFSNNIPKLQSYFLEIIQTMLNKLGENADLESTIIEIKSLLEIFRNLNKPSKKTIQGVWSELLIIYLASNKDYLIDSWHYSNTDIFDFNDGINKIEVKSTKKQIRQHSISLKQLTPNKNGNLIFASIMIIETGRGKSILDLMRFIKEKTSEVKFHILQNKIHDVLGEDFAIACKTYYDYDYAEDSLLYYDYKDLPSIDKKVLSSEISNVKFDLDFTNLKNNIDYSIRLYSYLYPQL